VLAVTPIGMLPLRNAATPPGSDSWEDCASNVARESVTFAYRAVMAMSSPIVQRWGRLTVSGLEHLPSSGPVLVVGNHDSYWDPIAIGTAAMQRRQIQALTKSSLWRNRLLGKVLDGMGQIPIDRGTGDVGALKRAITELHGGACIGIFPEGTRSRGRELRARSGLARIAEAVPQAQIVCCTVEGTVDIVRFPARPRIRVRFFAPAAGLVSGGSSSELPARLLAEIRAAAPIVACGRRGRIASPKNPQG
jgi:1-acyl-sn-glycerol-3-phosphate acyltransferase